MVAAFLTIALLTGQPALPIADSVPKFNVEATCKETVATDKAMGLAEAQSYESCMRDETSAQQQLSTVWGDAPSAVRASCEQEAKIGSPGSYVDLLSCIQFSSNGSSQGASSTSLRGGSKNRNTKK